MEMALDLGWFLLGLVLLALGGDSLVKGASGLAQRLGLSPFAAGVWLVAVATSLPELAVNARAMAAGQPALALGNLVGSNLVNFGLTLGLAALVAGPLLVRWRALAPLLLAFIGASAVVIALGADGALGRGEGALLLVLFLVAFAVAWQRSRREADAVLRAELEAAVMTRTDLGLNLLRLGVAAVVLWFGTGMIVQHAPPLGRALGMAPLLTGLLPVAIGTALPEIAAAIMAARRGQGALVAGHAIGSSVFNLLAMLGGMALVQPLALPAAFVRFEIPAAAALALALYPMLKGDLKISRVEGGILVMAFLAWFGVEVWSA
jgi:cation:H+ antiporter